MPPPELLSELPSGIPSEPPAEAEISWLAQLLSQLRDTYEWPVLRDMDAPSLLIVMERSVTRQEDRARVSRFEPWIRAGLLPLLSTPQPARPFGIASMAAGTGFPESTVLSVLGRLDASLCLGRDDFLPFEASPAERDLSSAPRSGWVWLAVLGAALGIALAAISLQVLRSRAEFEAELAAAEALLRQNQEAPPPQEWSAPPPLPEPDELPPLSQAPPTPIPPAPAPPSTPFAERSTAGLPWRGCDDPALIPAPEAVGSDRELWPVLGPAASLDAVRRQCRPDAFLNLENEVEVARFADPRAARRFADTLTSNMQHPFAFRVGSPSRPDEPLSPPPP